MPAAPIVPVAPPEEIAKPVEPIVEQPAAEPRQPLPRRLFKKQKIEAHQLAGKQEVERKKAPKTKPAPMIEEETLALDAADERVDPNDAVLSDREFYRTVHDWGGFSECLAKERTRRDIGSGAMRLLYKISPDGTVIKVKAITPSGEGALAIAPCVEKKAAKMRFGPQEETVKKIAKFVWVANDMTVDVDRDIKSL